MVSSEASQSLIPPLSLSLLCCQGTENKIKKISARKTNEQPTIKQERNGLRATAILLLVSIFLFLPIHLCKGLQLIQVRGSVEKSKQIKESIQFYSLVVTCGVPLTVNHSKMQRGNTVHFFLLTASASQYLTIVLGNIHASCQ